MLRARCVSGRNLILMVGSSRCGRLASSRIGCGGSKCRARRSARSRSRQRDADEPDGRLHVPAFGSRAGRPTASPHAHALMVELIVACWPPSSPSASLRTARNWACAASRARHPIPARQSHAQSLAGRGRNRQSAGRYLIFRRYRCGSAERRPRPAARRCRSRTWRRISIRPSIQRPKNLQGQVVAYDVSAFTSLDIDEADHRAHPGACGHDAKYQDGYIITLTATGLVPRFSWPTNLTLYRPALQSGAAYLVPAGQLRLLGGFMWGVLLVARSVFISSSSDRRARAG